LVKDVDRLDPSQKSMADGWSNVALPGFDTATLPGNAAPGRRLKTRGRVGKEIYLSDAAKGGLSYYAVARPQKMPPSAARGLSN